MGIAGSSLDKLNNVLRASGVRQKMSVSNTSQQSAAFYGSTNIIRVWCDSDCFILTGSDPTATVDDTPILAKSSEYFQVDPRSKIAVILSSGSGTFYILEG